MILALDFDGTTHPDRCKPDLHFQQLALLEPWLRRHLNVDLVISSSWREAHPLSELREHFAADLQNRILGVTPVAAQADWANIEGQLLPIRFEREAEIVAWLRARGESGRPWAALDDQAWRFRPFCKQLVVCNPETGLTEQELALVARILGCDEDAVAGAANWTTPELRSLK